MKNKCKTKYCGRRVKSGKVCNTCRVRKWREENKSRSSYLNLKHNSLRRGIEFQLTFEEFQQFCYETDYLQGVGKKKTSFSIDRIDPEKGYILSNLQVLTLQENSRKGRKYLSYDYQYPEYARVIQSDSPNQKPISFEDDDDIF